ncbi:MAG: DUF3710 domain-containing protein [Nocardioidaceae bacterium]
MIFRRRESKDATTGESQAAPDGAPADGGHTGDAVLSAGDFRAATGPWDIAERPADDDPGTIDLGGLVVRLRMGLDLRLQTDQETSVVQAVLLVAGDGAVELRAFAASRASGIWDVVRREIVGEASRHGGTATEIPGPYGPELRVVVPAQAPDGQRGTQTSRIVGVEGPRWLLRATYLGRPAIEPDADHVLESAVRDVSVVRGDGAMPPREPLPLRLPPDAQPVSE